MGRQRESRTGAGRWTVRHRIVGAVTAVAVGFVAGGVLVGTAASTPALASPHEPTHRTQDVAAYPGRDVWTVTVDPAAVPVGDPGPAVPDAVAVPVPEPVAVLSRDGRIERITPISDTAWMVVTPADEETFATMAASVGLRAEREPGAIFVQGEPYEAELWGLRNTPDGFGARYRVPALDDFDVDIDEARTIADGSDVVVAVIDSGVITTSPELPASARWRNADEVCGNGVDDDANGYVDDCNGWDFHSFDNRPFDGPTANGHGSHVAGTIAARVDGRGIEGVAPGAVIMDLRTQNEAGAGSTRSVAAAIHYAVDNGADVINLSLGGDHPDPELHRAIVRADAAGIPVVAAAGNDGRDVDVAPSYPSGYDVPNIVSVGASAPDGTMATFSNHGPTQVDLFAPGTYILSVVQDGAYQFKNGTSMAAPHVAGTVALMLAADRSLHPNAVRDRLLASADRHGAFAGRSVSGGHLNAAGALGYVDPDTKQLAASWSGVDMLTSDDPASLTLELTGPVAAAPSPTDVVLSLYTTEGDGVYGVADLPVVLDGSETSTDEKASLRLASGVDVPAGALAGGSTHELGLQLPSGQYALVVELVDPADASIAFGPPAVTYVEVSDPSATPVPTTPPTTAPAGTPTTQPPSTATTVPSTSPTTAPRQPGTSPTTVPSTPPTTPPTTAPSAPGAPSTTVPRQPGTSPTTVPSTSPTTVPRQPSTPTTTPSTTVPSTPPTTAPAPVSRDGITLRSLSPSSGPAAGGTNVYLYGEHFPEYPRVLFGGRLATTVTVSPTKLLVRTPPGSGIVDVRVGDRAGRSVTMQSAFAYTGSPAPSTPPTTAPSTSPTTVPTPTTAPSDPGAPPTTAAPSTPPTTAYAPPSTVGEPRSRLVPDGSTSTRGGLTLVGFDNSAGLLAEPAQWPTLACRSAYCRATVTPS